MKVKLGKQLYLKFYFLTLKSDFLILNKLTPVNEISPALNESPVSYAHRLSRFAAERKEVNEKRKLGQYFTPADTAGLMASFTKAEFDNKTIRVLDPGCGTGILSCALVEVLANKFRNVNFELTCYEIDGSIIEYTNLSLNYLKQYLAQKGIQLNYRLINEDFITDHAVLFNEENNKKELFDIVISNPPFFKIPHEDNKGWLAKKIFPGQANIYLLFVYASVKMLKENGEFIFLIPRSFCSGGAFKHFRKEIFKFLLPEKIHLFSSNDLAFEESGELSDSIIFYGKRSNFCFESCQIELTRAQCKTSPYIIDYIKEKNIIPLPASEEDEILLSEIKQWPCTLKDLGYTIHFGKATITEFEKYSIPAGQELNKALQIKLNSSPSEEYIVVNKETEPLVIENGNYIFLRRYNKIDKEKKICAFPYLNNNPEIKYLCVDKQLLYIYKKHGSFTEPEIIKLTEILNSETLNKYLKIIFGNINLSIEEYKEIQLPDFIDQKG